METNNHDELHVHDDVETQEGSEIEGIQSSKCKFSLNAAV